MGVMEAAMSARLQAMAERAVLQSLLTEGERAQRLAFLKGLMVAVEDVADPTGEFQRQSAEDLHDPAAEAFIANFEYDAIRGLVSEMAPQVRREVMRGIREGKNPREVGGRLADLMGTRDYRARMIARTEMNRAANYARYSGWRQSGRVQMKTYLATHDDRVREGHLAADGNTVPLDDPFTAGDAAGLIMPPIAPNCRCTAVPVTRLGRATGLGAHGEDAPAVALAAAAVRREIRGLRAVEDEHERRLSAAFRAWPRVLMDMAEREGRRGRAITRPMPGGVSA